MKAHIVLTFLAVFWARMHQFQVVFTAKSSVSLPVCVYVHLLQGHYPQPWLHMGVTWKL